MSNDKSAATYHPHPGTWIDSDDADERRARVAGVFRRYIAEADRVLDSPRAAILEALQHEVLDTLDEVDP